MRTHTYRVYFADGRTRIFEAESTLALIQWLIHKLGYTSDDFHTIEMV